MAQGQGRQIVPDAPFFKNFARGCFGCLSSIRPVQKRRDFIGKAYLGFVDLGSRKRAQTVTFVDGKFGIEFQKTPHISIGGVAPELPEFIRAEHITIQPDCSGLRLAHFFAIGCCQQRRGKAINLTLDHTARQVDTVNDVPPLVRTAHLQDAAVAAVQLHEIIGLQNHVIEFQKRQRLFPVEPRLDALKG